MSECECEVEVSNREEARILWMLLAINASMFLLEAGLGWIAESTGLIADSLDMFADAGVYAISLFVVGRAGRTKTRAAFASGVFQMLLAVGVLGDVTRRFVLGSEPWSALMIGISLLALAANVTCLALLSKHRHGEVHMRASWIFSTNDVIANLGVIGAGALVAVTGSRVPDLVIGVIIAGVVLRGGVRIIRDARGERAAAR